jgi:uncharacterized protein YoaH (UPF0181 family)
MRERQAGEAIAMVNRHLREQRKMEQRHRWESSKES